MPSRMFSRHALCVSSLFIALGAQAVLASGRWILGGIAAALSFTSIGYHATHSPKVRGADITLLWLVGAVSLSQGVRNVVMHGLYFGWVAGFCCIGSLLFIFGADVCYLDHNRETKIIRLPWHITVHAASGLGLYLFAVGDVSCAAGALTPAPLGPLQLDAWASAAGMASALVLCSSALHVLSGHTDTDWRLREAPQAKR